MYKRILCLAIALIFASLILGSAAEQSPGSGQILFAPSDFEALSLNDRGDAVVALQARLSQLGYLDAVNVGGSYDALTESAVETFQTVNALEVTGIADVQTLVLLFNAGALSADGIPYDAFYPGAGSIDGDAPTETRYIGNSNTMKLHYADCPSVDDMKPEHRVPMDSRALAIAAGYVPCKRCNP